MGDELRVSSRIFSPPSGAVSAFEWSLASSVWLNWNCIVSCFSPPRYPERVRPVAVRNSSLTVDAGAYANENLGCIDWRSRENGPKPGKNAKKVGDAEMPVCTRFD